MNPQTGTWNVAVRPPGDPSALIFSSPAARDVMVTIRKRHHSSLPIVVEVNGRRARNATLSYGDMARTFVLPAVTTLHLAAGPAPDGASTSADGDYAITLLEVPLPRR